MNVQYAIKDGDIYVLEVNPRASRTVPFVAKVIGEPIAKIAARIMAGESLAGFGLTPKDLPHIGVKEAVFPFARFPGVDVLLGPEMRSTGEVIGLDRELRRRLRQEPARLRHAGAEDRHRVRLGARQRQGPHPADRAAAGRARLPGRSPPAARSGSSRRTASRRRRINKVLEGRPHVVDAIKNGDIQLVFNTTEGAGALSDSPLPAAGRPLA